MEKKTEYNIPLRYLSTVSVPRLVIFSEVPPTTGRKYYRASDAYRLRLLTPK